MTCVGGEPTVSRGSLWPWTLSTVMEPPQLPGNVGAWVRESDMPGAWQHAPCAPGYLFRKYFDTQLRQTLRAQLDVESFEECLRCVPAGAGAGGRAVKA